jgi:hypothetical protein
VKPRDTHVKWMPHADDEFTSDQRRSIDALLDEAEKGPFHGPFDTTGEMIARIEGELKKRGDLE